MTFRPEEIDKIKQRVKIGEERSTVTLDGTTTIDTVVFSNPAEKVSYQAKDPLMTATVTISTDGENFIAGTAITVGAIITYSTHMIKAIRFTRTAGTGKIVVLAR